MISLNPLPSLPRYHGPYNVGSTEYEIPISEIDPRASLPDSRISTVKFRLFYRTDATSSQEHITWVPRPQKQWIQAFSSFLGASLGWSSLVNPILSVLNFITIPAIANAPLRKAQQSKQSALAIFSHGLAGNCNMYSAICGSLASCGVICAAPEHRDGSSPVSWVRGPGGKIIAEIAYQKFSHTPSADVFNGRNAQLRIRLWELDLIYSALSKMNEGQSLTNYACDTSTPPSFKSTMDFTPGHVTWLGHSFGAATITQFIKSIYYHSSLPSPRKARQGGEHDWTPLYRPSSNSILTQQITPDSRIALLDVWTLPFRAPSAQWLWEKPFPCYDRDPSSDPGTNTIAIMSIEFYSYPDLRKRTQALLSPDPVSAEKEFSQQAKVEGTTTERPHSSPHISTPPNNADEEPDVSAPALLEADVLPAPTIPTEDEHSSPTASASASRDPSPSSSSSIPNSQATASPSSSTTSLSPSIPAVRSKSPADVEVTAPKLFTIPSSAHLSQSDFGLLFPTLTRYLMKAIDPEGTIILNIRGITAVMRSAGLDVRRIDQPQSQRVAKGGWFSWRRSNNDAEHKIEKEEEDTILRSDGTGGRWIAIPLVF